MCTAAFSLVSSQKYQNDKQISKIILVYIIKQKDGHIDIKKYYNIDAMLRSIFVHHAYFIQRDKKSRKNGCSLHVNQRWRDNTAHSADSNLPAYHTSFKQRITIS